MKWQTILKLSLVIAFAQPVHAKEVIQFPEEELAKESVLPIFDKRDSVQSRNVVSEGKIEVGAYLGFLSTEPIYNQSKLGLNIGYHFNEDSAVVFNYAKWSSGLNSLYTDGLAARSLDFGRAPTKNYTLFGHYEWKMYYGKISLTKQGVMNIHIYPLAGIGINSYQHKNYFGLDFGIGQKFYFTKNFALRSDFKIQYMQEPSPFLGDNEGAACDGPTVGTCNPTKPSPNDFKTRTVFNTVIDVGVSFLF